MVPSQSQRAQPGALGTQQRHNAVVKNVKMLFNAVNGHTSMSFHVAVQRTTVSSRSVHDFGSSSQEGQDHGGNLNTPSLSGLARNTMKHLPRESAYGESQRIDECANEFVFCASVQYLSVGSLMLFSYISLRATEGHLTQCPAAIRCIYAVYTYCAVQVWPLSSTARTLESLRRCSGGEPRLVKSFANFQKQTLKHFENLQTPALWASLSCELLIACSSAKPASKKRDISGNPCDRYSLDTPWALLQAILIPICGTCRRFTIFGTKVKPSLALQCLCIFHHFPCFWHFRSRDSLWAFSCWVVVSKNRVSHGVTRSKLLWSMTLTFTTHLYACSRRLSPALQSSKLRAGHQSGANAADLSGSTD